MWQILKCPGILVVLDFKSCILNIIYTNVFTLHKFCNFLVEEPPVHLLGLTKDLVKVSVYSLTELDPNLRAPFSYTFSILYCLHKLYRQREEVILETPAESRVCVSHTSFNFVNKAKQNLFFKVFGIQFFIHITMLYLASLYL